MYDRPDRAERENTAAVLTEADRIINQANRIRHTARSVALTALAVALFVLFLAWYGTVPRAEAAPRIAYKGTVTITLTPAAKSDPYGQTLHKQWVDALPGAIKQAGPSIGKVKVCKEREPLTTCYGEVRMASSTYAFAYGQNVPRTAPSGVYKLVDCWAGSCELWESQVGMSDKVGAGMTKAQREVALAAALKRAIPR